MKTGVLIALAMVCALSSSIPAYAEQSPVPAPVPTESATSVPADTEASIAARAKDWFHRLQTGIIDRSQLTPQVDSLLTPDLIKQLVTQLGPLGDPVSFTFVGKQSIQGMTAYVYRVTFKSGTFNEIFVLDKNDKVAGIRALPAQ